MIGNQDPDIIDYINQVSPEITKLENDNFRLNQENQKLLEKYEKLTLFNQALGDELANTDTLIYHLEIDIEEKNKEYQTLLYQNQILLDQIGNKTTQLKKNKKLKKDIKKIIKLFRERTKLEKQVSIATSVNGKPNGIKFSEAIDLVTQKINLINLSNDQALSQLDTGNQLMKDGISLSEKISALERLKVQRKREISEILVFEDHSKKCQRSFEFDDNNLPEMLQDLIDNYKLRHHSSKIEDRSTLVETGSPQNSPKTKKIEKNKHMKGYRQMRWKHRPIHLIKPVSLSFCGDLTKINDQKSWISDGPLEEERHKKIRKDSLFKETKKEKNKKKSKKQHHSLFTDKQEITDFFDHDDKKENSIIINVNEISDGKVTNNVDSLNTRNSNGAENNKYIEKYNNKNNNSILDEEKFNTSFQRDKKTTNQQITNQNEGNQYISECFLNEEKNPESSQTILNASELSLQNHVQISFFNQTPSTIENLNDEKIPSSKNMQDTNEEDNTQENHDNFKNSSNNVQEPKNEIPKSGLEIKNHNSQILDHSENTEEDIIQGENESRHFSHNKEKQNDKNNRNEQNKKESGKNEIIKDKDQKVDKQIRAPEEISTSSFKRKLVSLSEREAQLIKRLENLQVEFGRLLKEKEDLSSLLLQYISNQKQCIQSENEENENCDEQNDEIKPEFSNKKVQTTISGSTIENINKRNHEMAIQQQADETISERITDLRKQLQSTKIQLEKAQKEKSKKEKQIEIAKADLERAKSSLLKGDENISILTPIGNYRQIRPPLVPNSNGVFVGKTNEQILLELTLKKEKLQKELTDMNYRESPEVQKVLKDVEYSKQKIQQSEEKVKSLKKQIQKERNKLNLIKSHSDHGIANQLQLKILNLERRVIKWKLILYNNYGQSLQSLESYSSRNSIKRDELISLLQKQQNLNLQKDIEITDNQDYLDLLQTLLAKQI